MKNLIKKVSIAGAAAAALTLSIPASAAELVTNGGFENGSFGGWTQGGNTGFTGVGTGPFAARTGTFGAFFGPVGSIGTLSQTLATVVGQVYNVRAWVRHDGGTPNSFSASFGGQNFSGITNGPGFPFSQIGGFFTATSANTVLTFSFRQDPAFYALDDVSVDGALGAVPEPTTWMMLILGFGLIGFSMRRRPTQALQMA